jgi:hypothetical protein
VGASIAADIVFEIRAAKLTAYAAGPLGLARGLIELEIHLNCNFHRNWMAIFHGWPETIFFDRIECRFVQPITKRSDNPWILRYSLGVDNDPYLAKSFYLLLSGLLAVFCLRCADRYWCADTVADLLERCGSHPLR